MDLGVDGNLGVKADLFCKRGHLKTGHNAYQIYDKKTGNKDGIKCKTCSLQAARRNKIKAIYGLAWEQYQDLLKNQNYKCAICNDDKPGGIGDWHVDHDHVTKKVRGLLCSACNLMIGKAKDNPEILEAGAQYLRKNEQ